MKRWNIIKIGGRRYLNNESRTPIRVNKRLKNFDLEDIIDEMNDAGVPLAFTEGLELINFTILSGKYHGFYMNDQIGINCCKRSDGMATETLIHEIGHHLDEQLEISRGLSDERSARSKHLKDKWARRSNGEYLSIGMERFYSLDSDDHKRLKKKNPKLYRAIMRLDKKYSNKK